MLRRDGWLEGKKDPCHISAPLDWFPVRDLTKAENARLNEYIWFLERKRYNRNAWARMSGAASYQGRGV